MHLTSVRCNMRLARFPDIRMPSLDSDKSISFENRILTEMNKDADVEEKTKEIRDR